MDNLLLRRRMMALPYDAQAEYLESNGTQYIDTGIVVNDTDVITCGCMFLPKTGDNHVFGSSSQGTSGGLWCEIYDNSTWYVRFGSSSSSYTSLGATVNTLKNIVLTKNYFIVNGTLTLQPNYVSMSPNTIKIFGNNAPSAMIRIYKFSIEDDLGNKRIELIPVRVGSVGYMYDRVSGQLFGNVGTGDFILGPDVQ